MTPTIFFYLFCLGCMTAIIVATVGDELSAFLRSLVDRMSHPSVQNLDSDLPATYYDQIKRAR